MYILFLAIYYNSVMARKSTASKKNTTRGTRTRMNTKRRGRGSRRQKRTRRGKRAKKTRRVRRRTKRSGRGGSMDALLAFDPSKSTPMLPNPHLAYAGKGGGNAQTVSPFVGKPWGAEIEELPGVSGPHSGNHYAANPYTVQPELNTVSERNTPVIQGGKRRRRTRKHKMTGGMFQSLSQLKNDVVNGMREFQGKTPEPSPLPYKDQVFNGASQEDNLGYLRVKNTYY